MKIQGFLAGLGVAGKVLLGVGVAAAATTGAGAAGVLPEPVQHAVSKAVDAVSPFSVPDGEHHGSGGEFAGGDGTPTTTVADVTTTTAPKEAHDGNGKGKHDGDVVVTPTTVGEHHGDGETTSTTVAHDGNGSGEGDGTHNGDGTGGGGGDNHETTPTTVHHGDGDNNNPESLTIHCERASSPARISCTWSASTNPDHARYALLRTGDGQARAVQQTEDGLSFTDTQVVAGITYAYRVISLRADGSVSSHSGLAYVECCGVPTTTTTVHHEPDGTTTTTVEVH